MAAVNLPLSGNVPINQAISPFMPYFPMFGSQVGSYTVNLGDSSDPAVEQAALKVASYGKQLGRIEDVLLLLLKHVGLPNLPEGERRALGELKKMAESVAEDALADLHDMLKRIADVKARHAPPGHAARLTIIGDRVEVEARTADEAARLLDLARVFQSGQQAPKP